MNEKITRTDWYPHERLIVTHISGDVDKQDVEYWQQSLEQALDKVEDHSSFKIFVNLFGFKAVDLDAHKRFRAIVPETLARYNWKVGYVDLFEEANSMQYTTTRGIQCVAAAHAHQDETKIEQYETRFGRDNEHFFTNQEAAMNWIKGV